jgi:hypothetical protein
VTLLDRVAGFLSQRDVPHAVIGATALAIHGVSRSTLDHDLLVVAQRVLEPPFWNGLVPSATADIRRGDADDPLAGVVRIVDAGERDVDIVVGRLAWQDDVLRRATRMGGQSLPVVEAADLILLKLYAAGSQDRWDIEQLLALDTTGSTTRVVDGRIGALPPESRAMWSALRPQV